MSEKVLSLGNVVLQKLPQRFSFPGTLDLTDSLITELPEGLFIQEDLIIGNAPIHFLPKDSIIGGNIYINSSADREKREDPTCPVFSCDSSAIVGGLIYINNQIQAPFYSKKNNYILLDNGRRFYYKSKIHFKHNDRNNPAFDRTPFDIYYGYSSKKMAVKWTSKDGLLYAKECSDRKEARYFVNYQDAIDRGMLKFLGYDIDKPRTVEELKHIFSVCTRPCDEGVENFLKICQIDPMQLYTLRELGNFIQVFNQQYPFAAADVFLKFFNIPKNQEEAN